MPLRVPWDKQAAGDWAGVVFMSDEHVDSRFYQVSKPDSLVERMVTVARDAIYRDFIRLVQPSPTATILDVGASDVINDAANMLEQKYPYPERLVAAGLGSPSDFRAAYPNIEYVQIVAGESLPFADRHFDITTSNAVLEHVGSAEAQAWFLSELQRVSSAVFLTVPNRFFPFEHHTGIPLLHWVDRTFDMACRITGKREWARRENLILMTRHRLAKLFAGKNAEIGYTGIRIGPFSSNLYAYAGRTSS